MALDHTSTDFRDSGRASCRIRGRRYLLPLLARVHFLRIIASLVTIPFSLGACAESSVIPAAPTPVPTDKIGRLAISCPADRQLRSLDGESVPVDFMPVATGGREPVAVECAPESGSDFSIGTTQVSCSASDAIQQSSSCAFAVNILEPPELAVTAFLAFGDSITAGVVSGATAPPRLDPTKSYPSVLQRDLASRYPTQEIVVVNAGAPGEWAASAIPRFRHALRTHRPQSVFLMEGTNDVDQDSAVLALEHMLIAAATANIKTLLMTIPPQRGLARAHSVPSINHQIRALAARRGAVLFDTYELLLNGGCAGPGPIPCIGQDGLHPTAEGYELIADELAELIVDLYDVTPAAPSARHSPAAPSRPHAPPVFGAPDAERRPTAAILRGPRRPRGKAQP